MKITLDKATITLAKKEEALQYAAEWSWIGKDEFETVATMALRKYHNTDHGIFDVEIIKAPKLEVVNSLYIGLNLYASEMIVKYWHKEEGEKYGEKMAVIGTTASDVLTTGSCSSAFVQSFPCSFCGVI